jgi:hypothetical protein
VLVAQGRKETIFFVNFNDPQNKEINETKKGSGHWGD